MTPSMPTAPAAAAEPVHRAETDSPPAARAVMPAVGVESGIGVAAKSASPAVEPSPTAESEVAVAVDRALETLAPAVAKKSHDGALRMAFQAYFAFRTAHPERVRKPYLYFVDYGLDNRSARGWLFDMDGLSVVDGPFMVAHGRGSSAGRDGVPTRFSSVNGSAATSLGLYVAQETYDFSGRSGGRLYRSIGLRLAGVSGSFNRTARSRGVVVHGAPYVTASGAGRSEGCPAMEQARARRLIPEIANGGLVFLFSPRDEKWMRDDPWVNAAI
jgi:hypothetical protein